jgi:hypothetical protein
MRMIELPTLEEMNGWMYNEDDDPGQVTDGDIDWYSDFLMEDFIAYLAGVEDWRHEQSEREAEWYR